jgi:nicotinate-nucleotide pyrophosphorylase (carboxylating)
VSDSWIDPPRSEVDDVVRRALAEDLGVLGDLTAGLVPAAAEVDAALIARSAGVLAGRLAATVAFEAVDPAITVTWAAADGDRLDDGQQLARVAGPLRAVLTAERTVLNLLGHLSGVATLTRRYADAAGPHCRVRDTRKTTPGLRALEKAAVRAGGGINHRGSLSDGVLVKDNHLAGISIAEAVATAHARWPSYPCQVECDTLGQVKEALEAGADLLLLDNMTPGEVAEATSITGGRVRLEVSGRVALEDVASYASAGADFVSVGALTHSAPVLDIGLDLVPGLSGPAATPPRADR